MTLIRRDRASSTRLDATDAITGAAQGDPTAATTPAPSQTGTGSIVAVEHGTAPVRVRLGGVPVDLHGRADAVEQIRRRSLTTGERPLGVVSVNLDHLHYFGDRRVLTGAFGIRDGARSDIRWLHLIDGAPIAAQARRATGQAWPRLSGSDLIGPILEHAEADGVSVGFIGGAPDIRNRLLEALRERSPNLRVAGVWSPARAELLDMDSSSDLAAEIAAAGVDILVVCLGKPRQELWIDHFGVMTGAKVLLAFGAVVDFLAGRVSRAPEWVSSHGMEWAWRLVLEPKRLAKRYLLYGPGAYRILRRSGAGSA
ncbi:WecB/TagA/CpsF family glycosyltransferase [Agromyces sp. Leaf222]|uniref:WecB/TagA/CpsF family glycosyltransferase n=1 Tax=Agromyces sp. Leaf222 TaxID=1735688 RepID=UPI0006F79FC4|nr:WecB/TagA/CpsF family glycosyltransferase [Agromyces sp. Leaf222]KQM81445.1 hypothetical protein ASE68_16935 [Agromyces sp. Leaf222]